MIDLTQLGMVELRDLLLKRKLSCKEVVEHTFAQAGRLSALNAFITTTQERALTQAVEADVRIKKGLARPLEGIPIAVKDVFCTKGIHTTAGSKILQGFCPPYESFVTQKLWDAGAILVGKTNMDEFAMGSSNLNSAFGAAINPVPGENGEYNLVPGGSSGGSAIVVAGGVVPGALGTDTGGSIRQPASFCGIVGLKPTYGRCSRWGVIAYGSSLEQPGPMTRNVKDAALLLSHMAGFDARDSTCANRPVPDYGAKLGRSIRGMKIGIPKEYRVDGIRADVNEMWDSAAQAMRSEGAEIVEISLPFSRYALPAYYIIACAEASSNLARYDGVRFGLRVEGDTVDDMYANTRGEGFGAEVTRRILAGTYVLSAGYYDAYFKKAQQVRRLISEDFQRAFRTVDALLYPSSPIPAFAVGDELLTNDPVAMYLIDIFTVTVNLTGMPAISIPFGQSKEGLPLGMQFVANAFCEETILSLGERLHEMASVGGMCNYRHNSF